LQKKKGGQSKERFQSSKNALNVAKNFLHSKLRFAQQLVAKRIIDGLVESAKNKKNILAKFVELSTRLQGQTQKHVHQKNVLKDGIHCGKKGISKHTNETVSIVESLSQPQTSECVCAQNSVSTIEQWSDSVKHVKKLKEKSPVYNLTVEGSHTFFANGILVHNCDSLAWIGLMLSSIVAPRKVKGAPNKSWRDRLSKFSMGKRYKSAMSA